MIFMKYIAQQEIKLQLRNKVFWIWILIMFVDIFFIQLGGWFFPFLGYASWRSSPIEYSDFVRLFFDYTIYEFYTFSIFIAGFILNRDRKNNFNDILNSKKIKPTQYILGRYIGIVCLYTIVLMSLSTLGFLLYQNAEFSNSIEGLLTFYKYGLFLIMPTMMFIIAVYFLLDIISNGYVLGVAVFFATYVPIMWQENIKSYAFKILIRLNVDPSNVFYSQHQVTITVNRIVVFLLSLAIMAVTIMLCKNGLGQKKKLNIK